MFHRGQIDASHIAINTDHRRQTCRQVKIRGALLGTKCQQFRYIHTIPQAARRTTYYAKTGEIPAIIRGMFSQPGSSGAVGNLPACLITI
jgi:hypothetical protein